MTDTLKTLILGKCEQAKILKVGEWDWVFFPDKPAEEIRDIMKEEKGFFNKKRTCWQFNNGHLSRHSKRPNQAIFDKYGAKAQN